MNAIEKHLGAINAGRIEKTNVIGMRKMLAHVDRLRMGYSIGRSNATVEDANAIEQALYKHRPRVVGKLHETGVRLLRSPRYGKRLADFAADIAAIDHFRLIRFDRLNYGIGDVVVPVYSVWSRIPPKGDAMDGGTYEAFRFRVVSWQSGGNGPEIVN